MSRSLGVLTLDLIARTGGFEQGMDRASRRVRKTTDDMEAARRVADRYIMAIGAAGVAFAGAAAAMAVQSAKAMDATAKMAQQIGTTTEALTSMRFATQQFANISDQQFDQAMRRMTRRIAEAAEGSGSAKKALDAMGLSARELARLSPDKQMLAIADAMQKTERQADRLRHTMAIFDTEGMALVPALQQGAAAFEQNIELARRFGVVVSTEAAQAAEQFTTNMGLLSKAQEGFRNQLAEAVLPMLADFSGHLVEIAQRIGPMGETIEKALKAAGVAAAATAAIFATRMVGALTAKVTAWTAATYAAAKYQWQMASLAATISGASTAITASSAAAAAGMTVMGRAAQLALGVLGGGAGLLVTTGLTAAAFLTMGRDAKTAATDVDALTESLDTLNRRQLESAAFNLENELVELGKQAEGHVQILRGMQNDYEALSGKIDENSEGMRNARQSIRDEEEALESVIATIAKKSPLLAQITQRLWDMDAATRGAAGGVDALNRAMHSEAGEKYLVQLQGQIKALQDGGDPIKIATRWISEHADATDADKAAIMSAAHALKALQDARAAASKATSTATKTLTEAQRAAQNFRREQEQSLRAQLQSVSAIHSQAQALEDQIAVYGLGKTAIEDLNIARLEEERIMLSGMYGDKADIRVEAIEREIEARKRLRTAIGSLEQKEAERQAWEDWARDVEQIFDRVGQSLTDAIFDGGKSGRDLLRDMFKGLTFNVLINPIMNQMQGWVTNQLGGLFGLSNPQQGGGMLGLAQNASSLNTIFGAGYQFLTGATPGASSASLAYANATGFLGGDSIGALIQANGGWEGALSGLSTATTSAITAGALTAAPTVAASLNAALGTSTAAMTSTTFSAALSGGAAGGAAAGGAAGASGLISGLATAAPWVMGGLAVASAFGLFDDDIPTTRRSQMGASHMLADGTFAITHIDDRQDAATQEAARLFAEEAVKSANDLFARAGVDAAVWGFQTLMESSILGDKQGVGSSGQVRVGDQIIDIGIPVEPSWTRHGVGGWSEAEMLPRLQADIQLTLLEAFQAAGDAMPNVLAEMLEGIDIRSLGAEQAQALAQSFQLVIDQVSAFQVAIESLPFANLRDLSFDAAANLIQFAGGLEALDAGMTSYFQNFYSEAEQLDWATQQIGAAFDELGLTMPDVTQGADAAKAAYRELVESLDVTTEEGQRAYATMMTLSGGFAELVTGMEALNREAGGAEQELDALSLAIEAFTRNVAGAERALQLSLSGGQLADRLGGMLGLDPVFAMRREQELWATIGQGSYEQQLSMSQELSDLVLARIDAEQQANQQRLTTLRQELTTYRSLQSIGASLQNYLTSLESSSLAPYTLGEKVGIAEAELTRLVQAARGGDETALRQVQGALQNALTLWRDYGASGAEYQDAYHRLTGMVGDLAGQAVSEAEAQLMQLELQAESLESISGISETSLAQLRDLYALTSAATDAAHEQYQLEMTAAEDQLQQLHLMGMDTARLHDIADLLQQLPASIAAQLQTGSLGYLASNPDVMGAFEQYGNGNASAFALQHYYDYGMLEGREFNGSRGEKYLLNNPDVMAAFFEHGANMTAEAFARQHYEQYGKFEGRAFARGGLATPGWALVGEGGPELVNFSQPGRVYTASQTNDILRSINQDGNGQQVLVNEVRALRQEVTQLRQQNEALSRQQVQAVVESSRENAKQITAGVSQAVERRGREDLNARNMKRVGVLA